MRTLITLLAVLTVLSGATWGGVPTASAQQGFEQNIRVIQQRPFLRKYRVEVAPYFAVVMNDAMFQHIGAGGVVNFHILDNLFIGAHYTKYFSSEKDLWSSIQDDFRVFPEKWELDFYAGGHVAYAPFYGKFILFNSWILHWDTYLLAGAGVTRTSLSSAKFTGNFGLGARIFLTRWLTLNLEVRDYIFQEDYKAGSRVVNNVLFQTGLSVFIPFGFDYRYPK